MSENVRDARNRIHSVEYFFSIAAVASFDVVIRVLYKPTCSVIGHCFTALPRAGQSHGTEQL
jgi:hypothetical protein